MVATQAVNLSLGEVKERLQVEEVLDPRFFPEWQDLPLDLPDTDRQMLDQLRIDFCERQKNPSPVAIVKTFSWLPLMRSAGLTSLFGPTEQVIDIDLSYNDKYGDVQIVRGTIAIMISHNRLWQAIIETQPEHSHVMQVLPQLLTKMMGQTPSAKPIFGLCTNGTEFVFIKLVCDRANRYALSPMFSMYRQTDNDLYQVVTILRHLRQVVQQY
jgi:hypothetical protein